MSNYRSFVRDFPARCEKLLRALEQTARGSQYDVSSALTFAAASIVIPFERLRRECHPSKDASTHTGLKQAFDSLMREKFLESQLGPGRVAHSWCFGRLSTVAGDPDAWPELDSPEPLRPGIKTRDMIFHLRCPLAREYLHPRRSDSTHRLPFRDGVWKRGVQLHSSVAIGLSRLFAKVV